MTGAPDPAQPARAEREAYAAAQIRQGVRAAPGGRREAGAAVSAADAGPAQRPAAGTVGGGPRAGAAAGRAGADRARGTIQAAQDFTTHTGHLFAAAEAFWRLDVVPQIDEMVRQRITPAEYERYLKDPERLAFLQALREHEIGGRRDRGRPGLDHRRAARPGCAASPQCCTAGREKSRPRRGADGGMG